MKTLAAQTGYIQPDAAQLLLHLGGDACVLQQHPGPHGRVPGHELPVSTDLGGSQQGFGVQVGEDAEESRTHLQDLGADHLVGFRRALFMAARFVVDPIRATWDIIVDQTHYGL